MLSNISSNIFTNRVIFLLLLIVFANTFDIFALYEPPCSRVYRNIEYWDNVNSEQLTLIKECLRKHNYLSESISSKIKELQARESCISKSRMQLDEQKNALDETTRRCENDDATIRKYVNQNSAIRPEELEKLRQKYAACLTTKEDQRSSLESSQCEFEKNVKKFREFLTSLSTTQQEFEQLNAMVAVAQTNLSQLEDEVQRMQQVAQEN